MKSLQKQNRGQMRAADNKTIRAVAAVNSPLTEEHPHVLKRCSRVRVLRGTWQGRAGRIISIVSDHGATNLSLCLDRGIRVRVPKTDVTPVFS